MSVATVGRLLEFLGVMRQLRAECSWKGSQTHRSLVRYLLEETHETVEAIEGGDPDHLCEELGDLLLQVWFHAVIAEESDEFTIDDVVSGITAKLRRRNPHVFGSATADDPASVTELWESIKATEKQRSHVAEGLPASLPALLYADKVVDRAARAGHAVGPGAADPHADPARGLGDRLLALVVESHAAGVDPEQALRDAVRRVVADQG